MEVVAKTKEGFLIESTTQEIKEIINSVTGSKPNEIPIGQKIPAIDYASTITKIKSLQSNSLYTEFIRYHKRLSLAVEEFSNEVNNAANIEL